MRDLTLNAGGIFRTFTRLIGARTADSNVFQDLEEHQQEIDLARAVLNAFVRDNTALDITLSPAQRFVKDQAVAFAQHTLDQMAKEYLTVNHFLDGIENLFFLGLFWKKTDESVAVSIGTDLCRVVDGLTPLIEIAERACRVPTNDWDFVSDSIREQLVTACPENTEALCAPSITHFHLDRLLGAGGFGAVYKAYLGDALCTVKLVPKSKLPDVEHAIVDKEVASMINHPCLVQYHATFATTEAYVTVMEYIRGVDVIRLVNLSTRLSDHVVRVIMAQLGLALSHLHYKGFVHRDVKPANMMIMVGCRVKLIDFDTAKVCIGKFTKRLLTTFFERTTDEFNDGEIAGTVSYMAPEMLKNERYGRAVDWWSFGITGYYLAAGKLPYFLEGAPITLKTQKSILCKGYSWPEGIKISRELRSLTKACLQKRATARFCSKTYSDFPNHPFFAVCDMRWMETGTELIKFDPINSVALGTLTFDDAQPCESPEATPTAESKRQSLFPSLGLLDTQDDVRIFTFLSPGFKHACCMIQRGETPSSEVIHIVPEFVDFEETVDTFHFTPK